MTVAEMAMATQEARLARARALAMVIRHERAKYGRDWFRYLTPEEAEDLLEIMRDRTHAANAAFATPGVETERALREAATVESAFVCVLENGP